MVALDQQSAPKQLNNEVLSHVVLVNNKVGATLHIKMVFHKNGICTSLAHLICQKFHKGPFRIATAI